MPNNYIVHSLFKQVTCLCISFFALHTLSYAQEVPPAFIRLTSPVQDAVQTTNPRQFIVGSTCKSCSVTINGQSIRVFPTGAFAHEVKLATGINDFELIAKSGKKQQVTKSIQFELQVKKPETATAFFSIEKINTYTEGDQVLAPGDKIRFSVKAFPAVDMTTINNTRLYEQPTTLTGGIPGIYNGTYIIQENDKFSGYKLPITITDSTGNTQTKFTENSFSTLSTLPSTTIITKGRLAHLEYGIGEDRLGGAKMGYIDSLIPLQVLGKLGVKYKVRLTPTLSAYIPEDVVTVMPKGSFVKPALTGKWYIEGDERYDYVRIGLDARLPYQSTQLLNPSRIVVDLFGATNNTNWINRLESATAISSVYYEQIADEQYRVTINLKNKQHWGHHIYYEGNNLVIRVKHQPKKNTLNELTIAIDAGHGGTNTGAMGPTGVLEKEITLALAKSLQQVLEGEAAKLILTRSSDRFFDNKERILFYRDSLPDLLISLHCNSSADPIHVGGTSTFFRQPASSLLSEKIYKRMLELGLKSYGNNGSFNFMLNSPTEYPNVLVETLFISNPEEEMKLLDPNFQKQVALKITEGIKDFLREASQ